ncbi:hypothetical protein PCAR4_810074 [Paraburkholderia caribensis]|nr:hypothetical protein PCAR4_810074 [Paraburkholderia caribensis]
MQGDAYGGAGAPGKEIISHSWQMFFREIKNLPHNIYSRTKGKLDTQSVIGKPGAAYI